RWLGIGAMLLAAVLLAGCGSSRVIKRSGGYARSGSPVKVSKPKYGASHVVRRGETVYRIATNNGITALDLALWNNIPPPYIIHPGQRLRLYPGGSSGSRAAAARPSSSSTASRAPAARPPAPADAPARASFGWRWPT